jgi:hypothetical protein
MNNVNVLSWMDIEDLIYSLSFEGWISESTEDREADEYSSYYSKKLDSGEVLEANIWRKMSGCDVCVFFYCEGKDFLGFHTKDWFN